MIERAVILEDGELITPASLLSPGDLVAAGAAGEEIIPELADSEYALLVRALRECNWVQKRAAQKLGISPRAIPALWTKPCSGPVLFRRGVRADSIS